MPVALALMSSAPRIEASRPWRWASIVALSLLIHVVALDALPQWTLDPAEDANDRPLRAILAPPAPMPEPAPAPEAVEQVQAPPATPPTNAPPARTARQTPRAPRYARLPDFVPESLDEAIPRVDLSPQSAASSSSSTSTQKPASSDSEGAPPTAQVATAQMSDKPATPPQPEALAPVSARLDYKVVAVERKNANPVFYYGIGTITWTIADARYQSDLKAAVDFLLFKVNVLASHSEGAVTPAGLAPDRYTETPRKRSALATNFNRDARQSISFSSSPATVPLMAGAQDRLSVLFQIGALLRANPDLATMGGHIDIPVAGVRGEVESWVFETRGIETIEVGPGPLSTAHLRRVPKSGSNDKTIDIWIAHADGGYPARVLYTEPNGSSIEMTLDRIEAAN